MSDEPASTRVAASTGPMHGAAHTAKAPPSRKREPRVTRALDQPRAEQALGPGQEPHEGEPEHHQDEPRDLLEQELVGEETAADEGGTHPEQHEDRGEAEDEGNARNDHTSGVSRLPQPVRIDGRDRGEIPRDERKHTRSQERNESGQECDRDRREIHLVEAT